MRAKFENRIFARGGAGRDAIKGYDGSSEKIIASKGAGESRGEVKEKGLRDEKDKEEERGKGRGWRSDEDGKGSEKRKGEGERRKEKEKLEESSAKGKGGLQMRRKGAEAKPEKKEEEKSAVNERGKADWEGKPFRGGAGRWAPIADEERDEGKGDTSSNS